STKTDVIYGKSTSEVNITPTSASTTSANPASSTKGHGIGKPYVVPVDVDPVRPSVHQGGFGHIRTSPRHGSSQPTRQQKPKRPPTFKSKSNATLVRIDTCIVGDDSTCDANINEWCRTDQGISTCTCRPGYARTQPRGPCLATISMQLTFRLDRMGDKKLHYNTNYLNPDSEEYQILEFEIRQASIDSVMVTSPPISESSCDCLSENAQKDTLLRGAALSAPSPKLCASRRTVTSAAPHRGRHANDVKTNFGKSRNNVFVFRDECGFSYDAVECNEERERHMAKFLFLLPCRSDRSSRPISVDVRNWRRSTTAPIVAHRTTRVYAVLVTGTTFNAAIGDDGSFGFREPDESSASTESRLCDKYGHVLPVRPSGETQVCPSDQQRSVDRDGHAIGKRTSRDDNLDNNSPENGVGGNCVPSELCRRMTCFHDNSSFHEHTTEPRRFLAIMTERSLTQSITLLAHVWSSHREDVEDATKGMACALSAQGGHK
ncbi:hypothetical protein BIW11_03803, partial [Tropilaelaps mercedesae]